MIIGRHGGVQGGRDVKRLDALDGERERIDAENVTEQVPVAREGRERSGEHIRERQARQRRVPASSLKDRMQRLLGSWASVAQDAIFPSGPHGVAVQQSASRSVTPEVRALSEGRGVWAMPAAEEQSPSDRVPAPLMKRHGCPSGSDAVGADFCTVGSLDLQDPSSQDLEEAMLEVRKSLAKMQQATRSAADALAEYGFSSGSLPACCASSQRAGSCTACGLEVSGLPLCSTLKNWHDGAHHGRGHQHHHR